MNSMNIPGFTAEASFYKVTGYYQKVDVDKDAKGLEIVPQYDFTLDDIRSFGACRHETRIQHVWHGIYCAWDVYICFGRVIDSKLIGCKG